VPGADQTWPVGGLIIMIFTFNGYTKATAPAWQLSLILSSELLNTALEILMDMVCY
jgi:diacylglycerol kinase